MTRPPWPTPQQVYRFTRQLIDCARDPRRCQPFGPRVTVGRSAGLTAPPDPNTIGIDAGPGAPPPPPPPPPPPLRPHKPTPDFQLTQGGPGGPVGPATSSAAIINAGGRAVVLPSSLAALNVTARQAAAIATAAAAAQADASAVADLTRQRGYQHPETSGIYDNFANKIIEPHWERRIAGTWTEADGTFKAPTRGINYAVYLHEHSFGNVACWAECKVLELTPGIGVLVCASGTTEATLNGYAFIAEPGDFLTLYRLANGVATQLQQTRMGLSGGDLMELERSQDNELRCYVDEGQIFSAFTDATYTSGRAGVIITQDGAAISQFRAGLV